MSKHALLAIGCRNHDFLQVWKDPECAQRGICPVGLWRQCLALKMRRRGEELGIHISLGWEAKVGVRLQKHQKEMGGG